MIIGILIVTGVMMAAMAMALTPRRRKTEAQTARKLVRGLRGFNLILALMMIGLGLVWLFAPATALAAGLAILRDTDLRAAAATVAQPALVVQGALDTLTPRGAGAWLAGTMPQAQLLEMPRAAHAPHLSHVPEVAAAIRRFAHG